jgi:DnaJ-class molecular chaperone
MKIAAINLDYEFQEILKGVSKENKYSDTDKNPSCKGNNKRS